MRPQFKDTIMDLARNDDSIVLVFGDVSVYLFSEYQEKYPERFYNLGICENTLVSVSAGLRSQGLTPFVHTIAPFLTERSFEQIKLDMCYNEFPVNIATCGASFDYAWDGASHHCLTDLAILRLLPNMEVLQPGSTKELDILLRSQYNNDNSTYFRLSDHPHDIDLPVEFGKGVAIKDKNFRVTVMTAGPLLANVHAAVIDLDVNLVYFHTIKPVDKEIIGSFRHTKIIVIHDAFGLYDAVCEVPDINVSGYNAGDNFCALYGTLKEIRTEVGLDPKSIREHVQRELRSE